MLIPFPLYYCEVLLNQITYYQVSQYISLVLKRFQSFSNFEYKNICAPCNENNWISHICPNAMKLYLWWTSEHAQEKFSRHADTWCEILCQAMPRNSQSKLIYHSIQCVTTFISHQKYQSRALVHTRCRWPKHTYIFTLLSHKRARVQISLKFATLSLSSQSIYRLIELSVLILTATWLAYKSHLQKGDPPNRLYDNYLYQLCNVS